MCRVSPVVALMLAALGGCSYLATSGPGANYNPAHQPECSTSRAAPTVDTIVGIAGAVFAVSMFSQDCSDDDWGICSAITTTFGTMGVLTAALWGSGALTGFRRNRSCRAAQAQHQDYIDKLREGGPANPWEEPVDWGAVAPPPVAEPGDEPLNSELCKSWRARMFAAPVGDARLEVIRQMPRECHE